MAIVGTITVIAVKLFVKFKPWLMQKGIYIVCIEITQRLLDIYHVMGHYKY